MYQPDQIDWQIIALLNNDGRLSCAEISRQLSDVSARTVKNRIDTLTKTGIIKIRSVVNPESVGYKLMADIFIEVNAGELNNVAKKLAKLPEVSYVACATGETDIIISVRSQNITELYNFVLEVIGKIPNVSNTQTYPLPLNIKNNTTWLPPNISTEIKSKQS